MSDSFTEAEKKLLSHFVTNTEDNVFVLRNLPEVMKGALFSRYSRSMLGLRSLLLKEFIDVAEINHIISAHNTAHLRTQKAQDFYDRILDGYGDDSIGELGGAHVAIEHISMLAAKVIEDSRIGGSPLEKSTRYIYFDQKVKGEYLYYREPTIISSKYGAAYIKSCDRLFETYTYLIPIVTQIIEKKFPHQPGLSQGAYQAALRARVLDSLRGLLPASTLTNMGLYGNGRFWEGLIQKLNAHPLFELKQLGAKCLKELNQEIPSFVRRAEPSHRHGQGFVSFYTKVEHNLTHIPTPHNPTAAKSVTLIDYEKNSVVKVAAALLYHNAHASLQELQAYCKNLSPEAIEELFQTLSSSRENRRHKSPRALEHAWFTFDLLSDFGAYRDLQRHRMLTQERQLLSCTYGYFAPEELEGIHLQSYNHAMEEAKELYDSMDSKQEAQYVVPMGYHIRWYFHVNLRALQWLCELRSSPAGHPTYRYIAQQMAKEVIKVFPSFACFFKFVDFDGYELGRMSQEQHRENKKSHRVS